MRYVILNHFLVWYIRILLAMRISIEMKMNPAVNRKKMESPSRNHAVSENGIYILRKTIAKRTEKVTVPNI